MAYQVTWLPGAIDDLNSIANYIAPDSPVHAASVVSRMLASATEASLLPYSCGRVQECEDQCVRQRIVFSYRLIFRIHESRNEIEVLTVIHGARLLPEEFRH